MQRFLDQLPNIDEEIKQTLSQAHQLLTNDANHPNTEHALLEKIDLEKIMSDTNTILESNNSAAEKCKQFENLLKIRWDTLKSSRLNYTYSPTLPITQYCYAIARLLHATQQSEKKQSIYKFLMPTLDDEHTFDQVTFELLDEQPLGSFILNHDYQSPIPLTVLLNFLILNNELNFSEAEKCKKKNPYHSASPITDQDWNKLVAYSKEGRDAHAASVEYFKILKGNSTIGSTLLELSEQLLAGASKGHNPNGTGEAFAAGPEANAAMGVFSAFLDSLSTDQKNQLFALHPGPDYSERYTFEYIWWILCNPEIAAKEPRQEIPCVGMYSGIIKKIIALPDAQSFLFTPVIHARLEIAKQNMIPKVAMLNACVDENKTKPTILSHSTVDSEELLKIAKQLLSAEQIVKFISEGNTKLFSLALKVGVKKDDLYCARTLHAPSIEVGTEFDKLLSDSGFCIDSFWSKQSKALSEHAKQNATPLQQEHLVDVLVTSGLRTCWLAPHLRQLALLAIECNNVGMLSKLVAIPTICNPVQLSELACLAIERKNIGMLSKLLAIPTLYDSVNDLNMLLHFACQKKDLPSVKALYSAKANLNAQTEYGYTVLTLAIEFSNHLMVDFLIRNGADVNLGTKKNSPLSIAIYKRDIVIIAKLLECNNINTEFITIQQWETVLTLAANNHDFQLMKYVIEKGPLTIISSIPLNAAITANQYDIVKLWVSKGWKVSSQVLYASRNNPEMLDILKQAINKESLDFVHLPINHNGDTELHKAISDNNLAAVQTLLDNRANVNACNGDDKTPLLLSVKNAAALPCVKALLSGGANINVITEPGVTALTLAIASGNRLIIDYLIEQGADVNLGAENNRPLNIAIEKQDIVTISKLLQCHHINTEFITIQQWKVALKIAAEKHDVQLIKHIIEKSLDANAAISLNHHDIILWAIKKKQYDVITTWVNMGKTVSPQMLYAGQYNPITLAILKKATNKDQLDFVYFPNRYGVTELHEAILDKDMVRVESLLDAGANANAIDNNNRSPLQNAVRLQLDEIADLLLEHKADITLLPKTKAQCHPSANLTTEVDVSQQALAMLAARNGNHTLLSKVLAINPELYNSTHTDQYTLLHAASESEVGLQCVKILALGGANLNTLSGQNRTALALAVNKDDIATVEFLIAQGADVNLGAENNRPLNIAIAQWSLAILSTLLQCDKIEIPSCIATQQWEAVLKEAIDKHNIKLIKHILKKTVSAPAIANINSSFFVRAITEEQRELLTDNPSIYTKSFDSNDTKLLHLASRMSDGYPCVKTLIAHKVDLNVMTTEGCTALALAIYFNADPRIITALISNGADVNLGSTNRRPLDFAIQKQDSNALFALLQCDRTNLTGVTTQQFDAMSAIAKASDNAALVKLIGVKKAEISNKAKPSSTSSISMFTNNQSNANALNRANEQPSHDYKGYKQ